MDLLQRLNFLPSVLICLSSSSWIFILGETERGKIFFSSEGTKNTTWLDRRHMHMQRKREGESWVGEMRHENEKK